MAPERGRVASTPAGWAVRRSVPSASRRVMPRPSSSSELLPDRGTLSMRLLPPAMVVRGAGGGAFADTVTGPLVCGGRKPHASAPSIMGAMRHDAAAHVYPAANAAFKPTRGTSTPCVLASDRVYRTRDAEGLRVL